MGQDTYTDAGVSVEMKFTFENRKHIYYLLQEAMLEPYVHRPKDYDEVYSLKYEYYFKDDEKYDENNENNHDHPYYDNRYGFSLPSELFLKKASMVDDQKEFDEMVTASNKNYDQLTFTFLYPFLNAHARNISRRKHPHIFEQLYVTPDNLIKTIQKGQELFLNVGVPPQKIRIGYSFRDSY